MIKARLSCAFVRRPMPKRPPQEQTASDLTARERILLFCVASSTYGRSGDQHDREGSCRTRHPWTAFPYGEWTGGAAGHAAGAVTSSEQQAPFVDAAPRIVVPAPGAWGRLGTTSVVLAYTYE